MRDSFVSTIDIRGQRTRVEVWFGGRRMQRTTTLSATTRLRIITVSTKLKRDDVYSYRAQTLNIVRAGILCV